MLTKKKKNHALRSLQLIGFTFEHEPCVNTQRVLIKPARADKYFFHSPFLSPHYTCLTLKLSFFCTLPPTTTPPAEPQTPQQKRERPGRGRQRLWSDKQFLFFIFPDISRHEHLLPSAPATISPKNSYLFWCFSCEIDIRGHPHTLESTGIQTRGILFSATVACLRLVKAPCRRGVLHFH